MSVSASEYTAIRILDRGIFHTHILALNGYMSPLAKAWDIFTFNFPKYVFRVYPLTLNEYLSTDIGWLTPLATSSFPTERWCAGLIQNSERRWEAKRQASQRLSEQWLMVLSIFFYLEVSLKIFCSKSNLNHFPAKSSIISGCLCFANADARGTHWCPANGSERHCLEGFSLHGRSFGRLICGQQRRKHLCKSMMCLNIKRLSSSVGTLWPAYNKLSMSKWPDLLSMKPDFWCHSCALFHLEAAISEGRGQVFKSISWFKLNSVIKGKETPHLGDLLQWPGTNPPSREAEGHSLSFKLAMMGQDCQHMNSISRDI